MLVDFEICISAPLNSVHGLGNTDQTETAHHIRSSK